MDIKVSSVILLISLIAAPYSAENQNDQTLNNQNHDRFPTATDEGTYMPTNEGKYIAMNEGKYIPMDEGAYIPMDEGKYIPTNEGRYSRMNRENYDPAEEGEYIPSKEEEYDDRDDGTYVPMDEGRYMPMDEEMYSYTSKGQDGAQYTSMNENDYNKYHDREYSRNDEKYKHAMEKQEYNHNSAAGLNNQKHIPLNRAAFMPMGTNNGGYVVHNENKYVSSRNDRKYPSANGARNSFTNRDKNLPVEKQILSMNTRQLYNINNGDSVPTYQGKYDRSETREENIPDKVNLPNNRQPSAITKGDPNIMYGGKYPTASTDGIIRNPTVDINDHVPMIMERYGNVNEDNYNLPATQRYDLLNNGEYKGISTGGQQRYLPPTTKILEMNERNLNLSQNKSEDEVKNQFLMEPEGRHIGLMDNVKNVPNISERFGPTTTEENQLVENTNKEKFEPMLNKKQNKKYDVNEICTPKSGNCDPFGRGTKPKQILKQ